MQEDKEATLGKANSDTGSDFRQLEARALRGIRFLKMAVKSFES